MDEILNLREDLRNENFSMEKILDRVKRFQVHEINKKRSVFGEYHHLFPILRNHPEKFQQYTRMSTSTFIYIHSQIAKELEKDWCNLHQQPILSEEQLVITIR